MKKKSFWKMFLGWTIKIIVALLIVVVGPLIINKCYIENNGYITVWGGHDVLAYYGTILSVFGTVYLGYVAIRQNDRLMKLESDSYVSNHSCDIIIRNIDDNAPTKDLSNDVVNAYEESYGIGFTISNHGSAILSTIELDFGDGNLFFSHLVLASGESKNKRISIPKGMDGEYKIPVTFTSCYGIKTYGSFTLYVNNIDHYASIRYYHYYGLDKV